MVYKNLENEQHWQLFVLILKEVANEKGISNYDIAKKTGYSESTIGRVFKLAFCPKLQIFLDIMRVLELNIFEPIDSCANLNLAFEKAMKQLERRSDKLLKKE
ncbi:helix-turn-helix domain-containing protein [Flavicella sp.]|uniref:helix-turn-helix domain-containing protein n=1 Tax=Flavicella sp. TaxID=2957742 RepID=UPI00301B0DC3